jgi:hypothetical protein
MKSGKKKSVEISNESTISRGLMERNISVDYFDLSPSEVSKAQECSSSVEKPGKQTRF